MAKNLSKTGIVNLSTAQAWHVTQSIDALTGADAYNITISGSLNLTGSSPVTGSFSGDGTNLTGITAEWDGTHDGDGQITGSLILSGSSTTQLTVAGAVGIGTTSPGTALHIVSSSIRDSNLWLDKGSRGYGVSTIYFRYQDPGGSIIQSDRDLLFKAGNSLTSRMFITGSNGHIGIGTVTPDAALHVYNGNVIVGGNPSNGNMFLSGSLTASANISASGIITADTGSFSHLKGNSPITVQDQITFQQPVTASIISASGYVSASTFHGDGSNLTGIFAGFWTGSSGIITRKSDVQISGSLFVSGSSSGRSIFGGLDGVDGYGADQKITIASQNSSTASLELRSANMAWEIGTSKLRDPGQSGLIFKQTQGGTITDRAILDQGGNLGIGVIQNTLPERLTVSGSISASGYVSASSFSGDGSQLTGISAGFWTGSSGIITRNSEVQITSSLAISDPSGNETPLKVLNMMAGGGHFVTRDSSTGVLYSSNPQTFIQNNISALALNGVYAISGSLTITGSTSLEGMSSSNDIHIADNKFTYIDGSGRSGVYANRYTINYGYNMDNAFFISSGSGGTTVATFSAKAGGAVGGGLSVGDSGAPGIYDLRVVGLSSFGDAIAVTGSGINITGSGVGGTSLVLNGQNAIQIMGHGTSDIRVGSDNCVMNLRATNIYTGAPITASYVSASGIITANTGSFSHLKGNSPITVQDQITFQQHITGSANISASGNIYAGYYHAGGATNQTQAIGFSSDTLKVGAYYPILLNHASTTATNITASGNISSSGIMLAAGVSSSGDIYGSNLYISASGTNVVQVGNTGDYLSKWEWHRNGARKWVTYNDGRTSPSLVQDALVFKHGIDSDADATHINMVLTPDDQGAKFYGNITASGNISSSGDIVAPNFYTVGKVTSDVSITTPTIKSATSVLQVQDNLNVVGQITASGNISSSGNVYGVTGSFSHVVGNSPITVGSSVTFTSPITASNLSIIDASGVAGNVSGVNHLKFPVTSSVLTGTSLVMTTANFPSNTRQKLSCAAVEEPSFITLPAVGSTEGYTYTFDFSGDNSAEGAQLFISASNGETNTLNGNAMCSDGNEAFRSAKKIYFDNGVVVDKASMIRCTSNGSMWTVEAFVAGADKSMVTAT